jgi:hypothetical protein
MQIIPAQEPDSFFGLLELPGLNGWISGQIGEKGLNVFPVSMTKWYATRRPGELGCPAFVPAKTRLRNAAGNSHSLETCPKFFAFPVI